MKRFFWSLLLTMTCYMSVAQGTFKIGLVGGIATDDANTFSDFALGIDTYYMFNKKRALLNIGPTVGFRNYFASGTDLDDIQFLPLGAAARIRILGISAGLDGGYAIGLNDNLDGGFYWRPILAFSIIRLFELNFSYEVVYDELNWANFNMGFLIQI
jgi:hypothetical protein